MSNRFLGWPPAVLATLITVALVVGELTDAGQRRWWATRPLTTDTVAGPLVLLITVLVVNELLIEAAEQAARPRGRGAGRHHGGAGRTRRDRPSPHWRTDRATATPRPTVSRTYMLMPPTGAPVLIDDRQPGILEQAQYLGGLMAHTLTVIDKSPRGTPVPGDGLQDAVRQLQSAAAPLLQLLTPAVRDAINGIGQTAEE